MRSAAKEVSTAVTDCLKNWITFTCTDMEDANISVQKVILSTNINISAPPLEISDALFLIF
jgi:hypothetical protein